MGPTGPERAGGGGGGGGGGVAPPADGVAGGGGVSAGDIQSESSLMMREGYRRHVGEQSRACGVLEHVKALASSLMRVAITGSSGLIGSALRARLLRQGHDVVPVVRRVANAGRDQLGSGAGHARPDRPQWRGRRREPRRCRYRRPPVDRLLQASDPRQPDSRDHPDLRDDRPRRRRSTRAVVGIGHRLLRRSGRHGRRRDVARRHRLPGRGLHRMGGEHGRRRRSRRARRASAHEHGAGGAGRCTPQDAAALQARPRRPDRQRKAMGELDLDRRRGRRDRAPAQRRGVRTGQPRLAQPGDERRVRRARSATC